MAEVYERLREYTTLSVGITIAVLGLLLSKSDFVDMYSRGEMPSLVLSSLLLLCTLTWFFSYYRSVRDELDLVVSAFDESRIGSVRSLKGLIVPTFVGFGIVFGGLIAFCTNILIYSILAWMLTLLDMYGAATINRNLGTLIFRGYFREDEGWTKAEVLFSYYFERPLLLRIAVILTSFGAACALALMAKINSNVWYGYGAYVLVIATIIVGLSVIYYWRAQRDRALARLNEKRS